MGLFDEDEPEPATVLDKPLKCQVCSNGLFWERRAPLHAGLGSLATCLVCSECGYVHWFLPGG